MPILSRRVFLFSSAAIFAAAIGMYGLLKYRMRDRGDQADSQDALATSDYEGSIRIGGKARTFLVHMPPSCEKKTPIPLVIVLHGGGGNSRSAARLTGFSAKADEDGFIVAYPDGSGRIGDKFLTWNAGNCCGYALENAADDAGFMEKLVDTLQADLNIDHRRIFVTGISNGGMMAYRLGCELSHRIAAIAPVAGALNIDRCSPEDSVSVIAIHGTADEHVLYEGGPPKKSLDPHPRVDRPVSYAISFWVKHNRCNTDAQRTVKGNIIVDKYSNGRDGTEVVLYTINGGGHAWPGGRRTISWMDEPSQEISATDIIWRFFKDHPKR